MKTEQENALSLEYSEVVTTMLEMRTKRPDVVNSKEYKGLEAKADKLWNKIHKVKGGIV